MRLLAVALLLVLAGCAPVQRETITVFAAASLTGSFEEIADAFEAENPNVDVVFNFGGSSALATQIEEGAPADVFASASPALLDGQAFATNVLEIAVATGNPGGVQGLADFANPALTFAVCAVEVPCGAAAQKLFETQRIVASIDTYEQDVKAVLSKVEFGEVDAGLVYLTDVHESGLDGIPVDSPPVDYPIAALTDRGQAFVAFVLSAKAQAILTAAGFGAP